MDVAIVNYLIKMLLLGEIAILLSLVVINVLNFSEPPLDSSFQIVQYDISKQSSHFQKISEDFIYRPFEDKLSLEASEFEQKPSEHSKKISLNSTQLSFFEDITKQNELIFNEPVEFTYTKLMRANSELLSPTIEASLQKHPLGSDLDLRDKVYEDTTSFSYKFYAWADKLKDRYKIYESTKNFFYWFYGLIFIGIIFSIIFLIYLRFRISVARGTIVVEAKKIKRGRGKGKRRRRSSDISRSSPSSLSSDSSDSSGSMPSDEVQLVELGEIKNLILGKKVRKKKVLPKVELLELGEIKNLLLGKNKKTKRRKFPDPKGSG
ncbi:MAG: hypothetical protein ACI8R9_002739 [Paraglaciecola sp.]